jgi:3,4-dihydroxy 2-butanone 4-phosphate synthase/GTP cyclohydrolase II
MCTHCKTIQTIQKVSVTTRSDNFRSCVSAAYQNLWLPRVIRRVFGVPFKRPELQGLFHAAYVTRSGFKRTEEHALIYRGDIQNLDPGQEVLIRINSACFTCDIFRDVSCDCNEQLEISFKLLEAHDGPGIILYHFAHDGKAHGYVEKLESYDGQMYPVKGDRRDFRSAISILRDLGITRVKVMTNNPEKVKILGEYGIQVTGIVPVVSADPSLAHYYDYKRGLGHVLLTHGMDQQSA